MGIAPNQMLLGQLDAALAAAKRAEGLVPAGLDPKEQALIHATLSAIHFRRGDLREAREAADRAAALSAKLPPVTFYLVHSYGWVAEVYLGLAADHLERGRGSEGGRLRRAAADSIRACMNLARVFPIAAPLRSAARRSSRRAPGASPRRARELRQEPLGRARRRHALRRGPRAPRDRSGPPAHRRRPPRAPRLARARFTALGTPYELAACAALEAPPQAARA